MRPRSATHDINVRETDEALDIHTENSLRTEAFLLKFFRILASRENAFASTPHDSAKPPPIFLPILKTEKKPQMISLIVG